MKKVIFAITALVSGTSIASNMEDTKFHFVGERGTSCSLNIVGGDTAPMIFGTESLSSNNWVSAEIAYDFATSITVVSKQKWEDRSAWGNADPDWKLYTSATGDVVDYGSVKEHSKAYHMSETLNLIEGSDKKVTYSMASWASSMTHKGKAALDAVVQFECK